AATEDDAVQLPAQLAIRELGRLHLEVPQTGLEVVRFVGGDRVLLGGEAVAGGAGDAQREVDQLGAVDAAAGGAVQAHAGADAGDALTSEAGIVEGDHHAVAAAGQHHAAEAAGGRD